MKFSSAIVLLLLGMACLCLSGVELPASAAPTEAQVQAELDQNLQTARWMLDYDRVAWATTDLLLKESKVTLKSISPVWFCMKKDNVWYAVYGSYNSNAYDIALCYREASKDNFEKVSPPRFDDRDRFARAISLTQPEIQEITRRTTVRFNYYIRDEQHRIALYYVPAFQPDGKLAYGIQHTYFLDSTGGKVVSHEQHGHVLIGAIPRKNRIVAMEMTECDIPTPQALFVMMCYRDHFADILTHCQNGYFGVAVNKGVLTCVPRSAPPPDLLQLTPGMNETPVVAPTSR